jgi:hypothetical protein
MFIRSGLAALSASGWAFFVNGFYTSTLTSGHVIAHSHKLMAHNPSADDSETSLHGSGAPRLKRKYEEAPGDQLISERHISKLPRLSSPQLDISNEDSTVSPFREAARNHVPSCDAPSPLCGRGC